MEVTLEEIVDAIETEDPDALAEILKNGSPNINDYCEVEDSVLMTPLLFSIKMKSPECVDVLLLKGADPNLSIKIWDPEFPEDESKQKSLHTNALDYAMGEKKNAASQDVILYDEMIEIILEAKNKAKDEKKNQKPENITKQDLSIPLTPPPNIRMGPEALMSPTATADTHRIAQRTVQNHLAIKKLTEENEILKKDLDQLKKEIDRFRPWIERWIYQGGLGGVPPSSPSVTVEELELVEEDPKQRKRTRHKSLLLKEAPKEEDPPRAVISPRGTSSKQRRRANSRKDRDTERSPSKGKSGGGTPQRPKSTALSKNPPGRSVSEKPKTSERHQGERPKKPKEDKTLNLPTQNEEDRKPEMRTARKTLNIPTPNEEDRKMEMKTSREDEKKEKKTPEEKREKKRTHKGEERKEDSSPQSPKSPHRNISPSKKRT